MPSIKFRKIIMKKLLILTLMLALMSCQSVDNQVKSARQTCEGFGFVVGTNKYKDCYFQQQSIEDSANLKLIKEYTPTSADYRKF